MQQITDKQFIGAVEQAVKEKGEEHRAQATYWNSFSNAPDCIIGAALGCISTSLVPRNNQHMADVLLPSLGVSEHVAKAGYAAQHLNDVGMEWKYVLMGFQYALTLNDSVSTHDVTYMTRLHVNRMRSLDRKTKTPPFPSVKASGGTVTSITFAEAFDAMTAQCVYTAGIVSKIEAELTLSLKKDHALVA